MFIDGTYKFKEKRLGVIIVDHKRNYFEYSIRMDFQVTNDVIEYKVDIFRVMASKMLGANNLIMYSDFELVVNQYVGIFESKDKKMKRYVEQLKKECLKLTSL